ncbi:EamA family transporter [Candidatus Falkowbacteria bacterium]|nr:EamA family transporter [Candidatus Falkowbacteria bacterium]
MIGYIFAVVSSLFFSLYIIPRKVSKQHPIYFSLFVGMGFFLGSLLLYLLKPLLGFDEILSPVLFWSILAGIIWAAALVLFVKSIDLVGLVRSNQWKNLQGPIGVILSLVILIEYAVTNPFFVFLAGVAVFLSAVFFTVPTSPEHVKDKFKGISLAVVSALGFGVVTVINKFVTTEVGVYSQQVVWSLSIFFSLLIYIFSKKELLKNITIINKRDISLGLIAGLLYLGASFFMLQAYKYIPASVGFTIIQLNGVWTILIGLFVFREVNIQEHYKRILLGFFFALIGIILLMLGWG